MDFLADFLSSWYVIDFNGCCVWFLLVVQIGDYGLAFTVDCCGGGWGFAGLGLSKAFRMIDHIKSAWAAQRPWTLMLELCFWPLLLALVAFTFCEWILNQFREETC